MIIIITLLLKLCIKISPCFILKKQNDQFLSDFYLFFNMELSIPFEQHEVRFSNFKDDWLGL